MARTVNCIKLGREAEGLDFPPYPGALGQRGVTDLAIEYLLRHDRRLVRP